MTLEPGLDLHEWESRWQQLMDDAADAPDEALPDLVRLAEEMLTERGFDLTNPVVAEGDDPDVVRDFIAARDVARALDGGAEVEREDVATALEDLVEIHDLIVEQRAAP
jgi:hypothetical protein